MKTFLNTFMAFTAMLITGCASNRASFAGSAGTTASGGQRIASYKTETKYKTVQPAPPERIEPYEGTWDGEAAIKWAEDNHIHGALYKPCHSDPKGNMCLGNEPWMTADQLRAFYKKQGKGSVYCGATWVQGVETTIPYTEQVPIYEDIPVEATARAGIVNNQTATTTNNWTFAPTVHATFAPGFSGGGSYGGGYVIDRQGQPCLPRMQPRSERHVCLVCGEHHQGRSCRPTMHHRSPDRERPIAHRPGQRPPHGNTYIREHNIYEKHKLYVKDAPPGYRPPTYGSGSSGRQRSQPLATRSGGFRGNNPGIKYYRR
jgi:hypothetical protein